VTPAPLPTDRADVGDRERRGYPDRENVDLLLRIPADARTILDVGCGTGALGAAYRAVNSGARLLGIERDPDMAAIARQRLDAVACVDVQQNPLPFELPEGIDCLIYGDVLQQLRAPWAVLRRQLEALNPGGSVLVCVANAEHWSLVARLFRGGWHYERAGLLDVSHLRWFSLRTVMRELVDAGLTVEEVHPRIFAPEQAQQFVQILAPGLRRLGIEPGGYLPRAMPLQYVVRARRAGFETTAASAAEPAKDQSDVAILEEEALIDIEASPPTPDDELPLEKLLMNFEALGDNCEFGLVQRQAGAEPLGLLRFASPYVPIEHRLRTVVEAIERRFEGLGNLDTVHLKLQGKPERREYLVHESAYQLLHHTFLHEGEVDPEEFRRNEARRLVFLRDKLLADLAAGEKLWVWKSNLVLSYNDIRLLLDVLRQLGPNSLLWVAVADLEHPPGTVERIESDLLKGYVDRLAAYDDATNISFESWYAVCRAAYALWRHKGTGDEIGAVAVPVRSVPASGDATGDSAEPATKPTHGRYALVVSKDTSFESHSLLSMTKTVELERLRDTPFSRAILAPADTIDMPPCYVMNPPSAPLSLSDTPHNRIFPRQMRSPEMWLARLDDVYYLPYGAPFVPGSRILINDFLVPWGPDAIGWFKYEGEGAYTLPIDLDEADCIDVDTAFFMGHPISGHFGHFIGDCLSRMHAWQHCRELFGDVKIILDHITKDDTRFRDKLLAGVGVKPEDIIFAQGPVRCRKLLFASPAFGVSRYASPTSAMLWQQIRDALAGFRAQDGERIYLSRSAQSVRKLTNEGAVEDLFKSFGFSIVHTEELPIEEQILIVSNAQLVAGPAGAAMFNLAFQKRLKSALILVPETFVSNAEWLLLAGARPSLYYHFGLRDMPAGAPVSGSDAWRIDLSQLASEVASWLWLEV
jgi:capsular polysaccharide biosynthesis protein/SAM-dependent methyltransferase